MLHPRPTVNVMGFHPWFQGFRASRSPIKVMPPTPGAGVVVHWVLGRTLVMETVGTLKTVTIQAGAIKTMVLKTMAIKTMVLKTMAIKTMVLKTMAIKTMVLKTMAIKTMVLKTIAIKTGGFHRPPSP